MSFVYWPLTQHIELFAFTHGPTACEIIINRCLITFCEAMVWSIGQRSNALHREIDTDGERDKEKDMEWVIEWEKIPQKRRAQVYGLIDLSFDILNSFLFSLNTLCKPKAPKSTPKVVIYCHNIYTPVNCEGLPFATQFWTKFLRFKSHTISHVLRCSQLNRLIIHNTCSVNWFRIVCHRWAFFLFIWFFLWKVFGAFYWGFKEFNLLAGPSQTLSFRFPF